MKTGDSIFLELEISELETVNGGGGWEGLLDGF